MRFQSGFVAALLSWGLSRAAAQGLAIRAEGATFGLFAYGNGIGGLPVFYEDGLAYITDFQTANSTDSNLIPVAFSSGSDSSLAAAPNTTVPIVNNGTAAPPFSSATFFVPRAGSGPAGFAASAPPDASSRSTGFVFFGHVAVLEDDDGGMTSLFWAVPTANTAIWELDWNQTASAVEGAVPVTLKDTPPANLAIKGKQA